jgi:glycine hydroxymethyltransferase
MTVLDLILVLIGVTLAFLVQYATRKWCNRTAVHHHHHSSVAGSRYDESSSLVFNVAMQGVSRLFTEDPVLAREIAAETAQQVNSLAMVAHASLADPSVLAAAGSVLSNVTAEGYPGRRFHPGAGHFDTIEKIAVERAKSVFNAQYANVQPHSCTSANLAVLFSLLNAGDTLLGLDLDAGGHLTHGSRASVSGHLFKAVPYSVDANGLIDYDQVEDLAESHRPKVIIAGASAYPRIIDYERMRMIADGVGAYLLADISHIAGLIVGGVLPSPVNVAHVTTTSTYKQLGGPRGGLILMGADCDLRTADGMSLPDALDRAIFPRSQGTPNAAALAAKARALELAGHAEFRRTARLMADDAAALASALDARGFKVLAGGTDTHMVLVDVSASGLTGVVAERALEECGILVNRNRTPGDARPPLIASGLRFGTNILAQRGMTAHQMTDCARLVSKTLSSVRQKGADAYSLAPPIRESVREEVAQLCAAFPFRAYAFHDESLVTCDRTL